MSEPTIRQASIEDRDAIWEFIRRVYEAEEPGTVKFRIPERWSWQFMQNPFADSEKGRLPIWIATVDDRIVGQYCAIPTPVKIASGNFDAAWGCDFIVDDEFRGRGIGFNLHRAVYEHYKIGLAVTFAAPTRHMWEATGLSLKPAHLYWYLSKPDSRFLNSWLGEYSDHPKFGRLVRFCRSPIPCAFAASFLNLLCVARRLVTDGPQKHRTSAIEEVFAFDETIDALSDRTSKDYGLLVPRTSRLLNWRIFANKQMGYRAFVAKRNDEVTGYVVLRRPNEAEMPVGTIVDLYAGKNDLDTINELLDYAVGYFGDSVCAVRCLASTDSIGRALKRKGFFAAKHYRPILIFPGKQGSTDRSSVGDLDCFFSFADHDADQIRPC